MAKVKPLPLTTGQGFGSTPPLRAIAIVMLQALQKLADLHQAGFKPIAAGDTEHLAAIGRLIVSFSANVDLRVTALLRAQLNIYDDAVLRAVVGDLKLDQTMGAVSRIAEATPVDDDTLRSMKRLWTEIHRLQGVRGKVAHRTCAIAGDKIAFHNALTARSDANIEIEVFSIKELNEFSDYAERLGHRISLLMTSLVRKRLTNTELARAQLAYQMILGTAEQFINEGKIVGKTAAEAKEKLERAHAALNAYADIMKQIGSRLAQQEYEANRAMYEMAGWLIQAGGQVGQALEEIPARLRGPAKA